MTETTIKRHYWNTDFHWEDRKGPFRFLSEEQVRSFDEQGFVVVEDLLDQERLERTVKEADAYESRSEAFLRQQANERVSISEAGAITFTTHLVARSPWMKELACSEPFTSICHDLIGADVRLYWDQAVYKKPEKPRRFPWHQDNGYAYVEPQQYLTCWLALTDATVENGCPWVVPGLHRMGTLRHRYVDPLGFECLSDHPDKVAAPVRAGGAVLFSSLTPHLTGPNTTEAVRKAYILQYAPDGARVLQGDPREGPPTEEVPCTAPERQFPVLEGGVPSFRA